MLIDLDILESITNIEPQLNDAVLNNENMDTEDNESENVEALPITILSVTENPMFYVCMDVTTTTKTITLHRHNI